MNCCAIETKGRKESEKTTLGVDPTTQKQQNGELWISDLG
jgi:hypothetical protein